MIVADFRLKTNAVGWAMLISNIAVEVDINKYWSVTLPVYYSALNYFTRTRKLRTLAFQPEVRWWFAPKWFVGARLFHLKMSCFPEKPVIL